MKGLVKILQRKTKRKGVGNSRTDNGGIRVRYGCDMERGTRCEAGTDIYLLQKRS